MSGMSEIGRPTWQVETWPCGAALCLAALVMDVDHPLLAVHATKLAEGLVRVVEGGISVAHRF